MCNSTRNVIVSVKDSGAGIDSEICQDCFQSLLQSLLKVLDLDYSYHRE